MQENTKCAQLLKQEIHRELQDMDNTSLDIFRMFKSNNNLLPKNKRILNLSWRMNSINRVKKNSKRNKTKHLSVNVNEKLDFLSHSLNSTSPSDSISLMSKQASYSTLGSCSPTKYCNNNISLLNNNHSENLINHNPNSSDSTEFDYIEHIRRLSREEYGITKNSSSTHYSSLSPEKNFFSLSKQATKSSLSTKRYPSNLTDTDLSSRSMENKNNKKIDFSLDLSDEFNIESYLNFGDSMNNLSTSHSKDLSNYISTLESSLNNESYIHNHTHADNYPTPLTITTSPTLTQSSKLSPGKSSTGQPVCENCFTTTTPLWRKTTDHRLLCNACGLFFKLHGVIRPPANQPESTVSNDKKEYSATKNINIVDLGSAYNTDDIHMGETLASDWDWLKFDI